MRQRIVVTIPKIATTFVSGHPDNSACTDLSAIAVVHIANVIRWSYKVPSLPLPSGMFKRHPQLHGACGGPHGACILTGNVVHFPQSGRMGPLAEVTCLHSIAQRLYCGQPMVVSVSGPSRARLINRAYFPGRRGVPFSKPHPDHRSDSGWGS